MGQKAAVFEKKPELINAVMEDPRLLKMVGVKSTTHEPGYTQRYDHGTIPVEALKKLVDSPNFSKVEFLQKLSQKPDDSNPDIDMSKLGDMVKNMDMSKIGDMVGSEEMSKLGKIMGDVNPEKLGETIKSLDSNEVLNTDLSLSEIEETPTNKEPTSSEVSKDE